MIVVMSLEALQVPIELRVIVGILYCDGDGDGEMNLGIIES